MQVNHPLIAKLQQLFTLFGQIPDSLIAFLGRFAIAAVFWRAGQTKIEGFAIDLFKGEFKFGWPTVPDTTIALFRDEYNVPLLPAELAAPLAAVSEHLFPLMLLFGIATRFGALGLLGMTMTIQFFVYPNAYPDHATWAAVLLLIIAKGPGKFSIDHLIATRLGKQP